MNKELDALLLDALEKTQAGIGEAVGFALEQAPDVIQQLLMWKFLSSFLPWLVFGVLGCYAVCMLLRYAIIKPEEGRSNLFWDWSRYSNEHDASFFWMPVACSVCVPPVVLLSCSDWLKIWIAPKLYLLEYAASLVK